MGPREDFFKTDFPKFFSGLKNGLTPSLPSGPTIWPRIGPEIVLTCMVVYELASLKYFPGYPPGALPRRCPLVVTLEMSQAMPRCGAPIVCYPTPPLRQTNCCISGVCLGLLGVSWALLGSPGVSCGSPGVLLGIPRG